MSSLDAFARALFVEPAPSSTCWRPLAFRLLAGEWERFERLCQQHHVDLIDCIDRQLVDLAAVRFPSSPSERERFAERASAGCGGRAFYGKWVYLPWQRTVAHLLEKDEYFEVITNRNQDKITHEEQRLLRTKRVGVIGLSVGGEAAVTVAQEHLCGEMVLADFDRLDLSNLNRLGAGFDDLGRGKAVIVARRIVKVDPYLELELFENGLTTENLDAFFDGLDLVIEECDDLRMKHAVRVEAKKRGVNLVFAADERGFLSVEPYAHHPELRTFHGRVEASPLPRETFPTPLAFMKVLTAWMGGWDRISSRSQRSLERIGDTLCGYPQLASEARYAAGQVGHVARRLLLGERLRPFIGNIDCCHVLAMNSP